MAKKRKKEKLLYADRVARGCLWYRLNTDELRKRYGLKRVYSGGEGGTGTLLGYRKVAKKKKIKRIRIKKK